MVEPTESESLAELDHFCDAMIINRGEIAKSRGRGTTHSSTPHRGCAAQGRLGCMPTARAGGPSGGFAEAAEILVMGRVDNVCGDRNLFCSCVPVSSSPAEFTAMAVSVFDLVGIGPSSSHTVGPMRAARYSRCAADRAGSPPPRGGAPLRIARRLAGHGSIKAVLLGLMGQ